MTAPYLLHLSRGAVCCYCAKPIYRRAGLNAWLHVDSADGTACRARLKPGQVVELR